MVENGKIVTSFKKAPTIDEFIEEVKRIEATLPKGYEFRIDRGFIEVWEKGGMMIARTSSLKALQKVVEDLQLIVATRSVE